MLGLLLSYTLLYIEVGPPKSKFFLKYCSIHRCIDLFVQNTVASKQDNKFVEMSLICLCQIIMPQHTYHSWGTSLATLVSLEVAPPHITCWVRLCTRVCHWQKSSAPFRIYSTFLYISTKYSIFSNSIWLVNWIIWKFSLINFIFPLVIDNILTRDRSLGCAKNQLSSSNCCPVCHNVEALYAVSDEKLCQMSCYSLITQQYIRIRGYHLTIASVPYFKCVIESCGWNVRWACSSVVFMTLILVNL